jgi:hypothetical protein
VANQPHIVEIYHLTRSVKTTHIDEFLLEFMWGGTSANVKWVDDEHALAVFPCAEAAQVLLDSSQKEFKVRPYNKASGAALQIAADGERCAGGFGLFGWQQQWQDECACMTKLPAGLSS